MREKYCGEHDRHLYDDNGYCLRCGHLRHSISFAETTSFDMFKAPRGVWTGNESWWPDGTIGEWVHVGDLLPGFNGPILNIMQAQHGTAYGLYDAPVDVDGNGFVVTDATPGDWGQLDGPIPLFNSPIIAAPEPATLAMFILLFTRNRRY